MKLSEMIKKRPTTEPESSKSSNCSSSKALKVANPLKSSIFKSNKSGMDNTSNIHTEGNMESHSSSVATATPATSATHCFSPHGVLSALIKQGKAERWTNKTLFEQIDRSRIDGALTSPWGLLIHDSPIIAGGLYWILSDTTARQRVPAEAISFTIAEIKPLIEISRVFQGAKVVEVIKDDSDANKN